MFLGSEMELVKSMLSDIWCMGSVLIKSENNFNWEVIQSEKFIDCCAQDTTHLEQNDINNFFRNS